MKKLTTCDFIDKFYKRFSDGLNLDLSSFEYKTARNKSVTICKSHNIQILNSANNLMQGIRRCPTCKSESISNAQAYTILDFTKKSEMIHGKKYDYSLVSWKNSRTKVDIICKEHGIFSQNPQSHWNGYGCPKCGYVGLRKTKDNFVNDATLVHNNRYDYTDTEYYNNYTKVTINCKVHGNFIITPVAHTVYQRGCPECFPGNQSWVEISWLDSLGIPIDCRQKRITIGNTKLLVDGKIGNTIYEFWGDFWHGNPNKFSSTAINGKNGKTFGELYKETMIKRNLILSAGFDLVEIWESDFNNKIKI
jgi:hypothetical protein